MKKILLWFFGFVYSHLAAGQLVVNPQAGMIFSNPPTAVKNSVTARSKAGFTVGFNLRIGRRVYVSPGAYWSQINSALEARSFIRDQKNTVQLSTLHVPLLIGWKMLKSQDFNIRLSGGPAGYFITGVKPNDFAISRADLKNIYTVKLGAGIDLYRYTFDFNYNIGLNTPYKTLTDVRYSPFGFTFGYKLGIDG